MRSAVLSDIHGNLEALSAVLQAIAGMRADQIVCLGDLVGYNADPNECVDIARSEHMVCVLGNHDAVACGLTEPDNFNPLAKQAVLWTQLQLTGRNRAFLRELPRETMVDGLFLCHGAIHDTDRYIMTLKEVRENLDLLAALPGGPRVCFHGHTHLRTSFSAQGSVLVREFGDDIWTRPDRRYLINPGAVGQPRDGDPRAAFAVHDSSEKRITFHRVAYDVQACQDKIIRTGLPPRLAERLATGW